MSPLKMSITEANFHGDYVALASDQMRIAYTKLGLLLERQLNYLLNDRLNGLLTPFINSGRLGLNFGLQGMQFTATSTAAENQTISTPMSIHTISTNNDNQDIVSMGFNAALLTQKVIRNDFEVLAICLTALVNAVQYLDLEKDLAPAIQKAYQQMVPYVSVHQTDRATYADLQAFCQFLMKNNPAS